MFKKIKEIFKPWYHKLLSLATNRYTLGGTLQGALTPRLLRSVKRDQITVGYWNAEEDTASKVVDEYINALHRAASLEVPCYLSIKAPAFGFDLELLRPLLILAEKKRVGLHFDSLAIDTVDPTRALLEKIQNEFAIELGMSLPGRWPRSVADGIWAKEHGIYVRVLKGEWADPACPDYNLKEGFLALVRSLSHNPLTVRLASHDIPTIKAAVEILEQSNTAHHLELLYGLPRSEMVRFARQKKIPLRFYLPYGKAWLPYCMDSIQKKPYLAWWLVKDAFIGFSGRFSEILRSVAARFEFIPSREY